jgi:hypothetical protein
VAIAKERAFFRTGAEMKQTCMNKLTLLSVAAVMLLAAATLRAAEVKPDYDNAQWSVTLVGFFPGEAKKSNEPKRLNCYLVRRDGKWTAALGTATNSGRPNWNTAFMLVDPANATVKDGRLTGSFSITLVPDPWVPKDQKTRTAKVSLDATATPKTPDANSPAFANLSGKWSAQIEGPEEELKAALLQSHGEGEIIGGVGPIHATDLSSDSYDLAIYNLTPGKTPDQFQRRRALSLGVKGGKVVSARLGQMDMRHNAYDYEVLETPSDFKVTPDAFEGVVAFESDTLEGGHAQFNLKLQGRRVHDFAAGTWTGNYVGDDGKRQEISGFFKGNIRQGAFESTVKRDDRPWFVESKNFQPPQPGEHPRLFFRKTDVPELRRRADTPEGKQIIARLRKQLNGSDGESMPTVFNPAKQAYEKNGFKDQVGAYTISHGAGFGFLYQLTGDKKYADLARQCVEKAWTGQRSSDDRYSWVAPGGELRAGPSVGWTAAAYDLCYDAWPEDFRVKVAQAIQNYNDSKGGEWNNPEGITLAKMILTPRQGPGSNHFGAVVGGCGLAVLAIKDDPGTDRELLKKYLEILERQVVRHLSAGWGDGGYYKEGWGASRVGTQGGFLCFLQALKTARGHDYLNVDRPNASYVTMVPRSLLVLRDAKQAYFPYRSNMGGTYGNPDIGSPTENDGMSQGGHFSEGFGAVADRYKPALLWTYNHLFCPKNEFQFDTLADYPHRSMLALVNWPTFSDIKEANPADAMPLVVRDSLYEHFAFRNGFRGDAGDIVTTVLINYPDGTKPRDVMVWGLGGLRLNFGEPKHAAKVTQFAAKPDGSGVIAAGDWAIAVDYSRASGADALIVTTGGTPPRGDLKSEKAKASTVNLGGTTINILTLSASAKHPEPKVEGNQLIMGGQTISFNNGSFVLSK